GASRIRSARLSVSRAARSARSASSRSSCFSTRSLTSQCRQSDIALSGFGWFRHEHITFRPRQPSTGTRYGNAPTIGFPVAGALLVAEFSGSGGLGLRLLVDHRFGQFSQRLVGGFLLVEGFL